jgi:aldehyde dehydrogenase (NAD+)
MNNYAELFKTQQDHRWKISRTSPQDRIIKLKKLKNEILRLREEIKLALHADFKKPHAESELTEIHTVIDEINFAIKNLKRWMKPKKVPTPIALWGTSSAIHYESKGVVLILSPWNYPFSLMINPIVAAVAAGNCIIGKPSEKTPHTSEILKKIIESVFPQNEVAMILGGVEVAQSLLELPFDHIFFTGSISVGKKIMEAAAKNLTPVTLELGGKSPVIIDTDVDLEHAVLKIAWGKFINGGQTCVAPDYVFVPESIKDRFISLLSSQIENFYGKNPEQRRNSPDFARLIDKGSFNRLKGKIINEQLCIDDPMVEAENFMAPTFFETTLESEIMRDEIFGPILPIISYRDLSDPIRFIQSRSKPLALYIFSKEKSFIENILSSTTSGGVAINEVILQLANPHLPFGGIGHSGLGSYHGHFGFKVFSHERAIVRKNFFSLIHLYFPPYKGRVNYWAYKLLRFLE